MPANPASHAGDRLVLSDGSVLPSGGNCFLVGRLSRETLPQKITLLAGAMFVARRVRWRVVEAADCRVMAHRMGTGTRHTVRFRHGHKRRWRSGGGAVVDSPYSPSHRLYAFADYRPAKALWDELDRDEVVGAMYALLAP